MSAGCVVVFADNQRELCCTRRLRGRSLTSLSWLVSLGTQLGDMFRAATKPQMDNKKAICWPFLSPWGAETRSSLQNRRLCVGGWRHPGKATDHAAKPSWSSDRSRSRSRLGRVASRSRPLADPGICSEIVFLHSTVLARSARAFAPRKPWLALNDGCTATRGGQWPPLVAVEGRGT